MQLTKLEKFNPLMVVACEAAINEKLFYHDEFKKFVIKFMGGHDCQPHLVGIYSIDQNTGEFLKTYHKMLDEINTTIKASPRGHYAIVERIGVSSHYSMIVSDGTGEIAVGGKFNSYMVPPTGNEVIDCMISHEIYLCRKLVESRDNLLQDKNILNRYQFYVGQKFKNLQSAEHYPTHKFGTTTIVEIQPDSQIKVNHTKRGSKNTWSGLVSPTLLSNMIEWAKGKSEQKKPEEVKVSLF